MLRPCLSGPLQAVMQPLETLLPDCSSMFKLGLLIKVSLILLKKDVHVPDL